MLEAVENGNVRIRVAEKSDCLCIFQMIKKLAKFQNLPDAVKITVEDLERHGFEEHLFESLIAYNLEDNAVIGFALYFFKYSTWDGKVLYLEDIFVEPNFRKAGIGTALFHKVSEAAVKNGCRRMELSVLEWNTHAIKFYKKLGFQDITHDEGWHTFRLYKNTLQSHNVFDGTERDSDNLG